MSTEPVNIKIKNGPSADRVMDAFKYAYDPLLALPIRPWFEIELTPASIRPYRSIIRETTDVLATVIGVEYESGLHGMFTLRLEILDGTYMAFYNANTRKGSLTSKL